MRIPDQISLGLTISVLDSSISLCKCNNIVDMIIIRCMVMWALMLTGFAHSLLSSLSHTHTVCAYAGILTCDTPSVSEEQ